MRILIITPYFHPFENPRAFRWTSIAKEWIRQSHEVDVLTSRASEISELKNIEGMNIIAVGRASVREWGRKKLSYFNNKLIEPAKWFMKSWMWPDSSQYWIRPAGEKGKLLLKGNKYDLVISVSLPFSSHLVAFKLRKEFDFKWIVDIGDPFIMEGGYPINNHLLYKRKNKEIERAVFYNCDFISVTNENLAMKYRREYKLNNISVIPPLASGQMIDTRVERKNNKIRIGYFGSFYERIRSPKRLKRFLAELTSLKDEICIEFYGNIKQEFVYAIKMMSLRNKVETHFYEAIPRSEVLEKMREMTFLLSIGNKSNIQLPSKIIDYIISQRPIIHLSSIGDDPVCRLLSEHNCAIICNEDFKGLHDFIRTEIYSQLNREIAERIMKVHCVESIAKDYITLLKRKRTDYA